MGPWAQVPLRSFKALWAKCLLGPSRPYGPMGPPLSALKALWAHGPQVPFKCP